MRTKSADGSRPAQSAPGGLGAVNGTATDRNDMRQSEQEPLYARLSPDLAAGPVAQALQASALVIVNGRFPEGCGAKSVFARYGK